MKLEINKKVILEETYTKLQTLGQLASIPIGAAIGAGTAFYSGNDDYAPAAAGVGATAGLLGSTAYLSKMTPEGQALNAKFDKIHQRDLALAKANGTLNPIARTIYT